ncbi:MAG: hypothetical protein KY461_13640 [Actinobacteria bacterium]|nr:hypothetical protein [Actinomycetota bacterium]
MADRYTSRVALVVDGEVDVAAVVKGAGAQGDIDRGAPVPTGDPSEAQEVHWGGRMQKAIVRRVVDEDTGEHLLRTETYIGDQGVEQGMSRQAKLLQALSRQLRGRVRGVRDLSAMTERDEAWMNRLAVGSVTVEDAIVVRSEGEGTHWMLTHGGARFDVPDLELYGLARAQLPAAEAAIRQVHAQVLRGGLAADLSLPTGEAVYLVPVLEAWGSLEFAWPGIGRAGQDRGPGLDGPRATLSIRHRPRFGRYRKDLTGVLKALPAEL